jgi:hypothetical protein
MLPLELLPLSLGIDRCIGKATGFLLTHLSILGHLRKLTLETGDLSSKALYILTSRG